MRTFKGVLSETSNHNSNLGETPISDKAFSRYLNINEKENEDEEVDIPYSLVPTK